MTIPASKLVRVLPGVLTAGGAALALSGLILTTDPAVPIGSVSQFSTPDAVGAFFGLSSLEKSLADYYFAGYDNSTAKPANLLFSQYPTASVAAYARSASFAGVSLATLQAIPSGVLTFTVDGVVKTSTAIVLAAATSFSNAATLITAAFTGLVVTYDSQRAAFVATSGTTGAASTITYGSGTISTALKFTQAAGAVTSQGSIAATPSAAMTTVTGQALNWASFMTTFEPLLADKILFGTWAAQQVDRFAYVAWDTDVLAGVSGNTSAFGPQSKALSLSGSIPVSADPARAAALGVTLTDLTRPLAAMIMGYAASLNFAATNGRATLAFRSAPGIVAGVADATIGDNMIANGYNFYGDYATSSQAFRFVQPGQVSGRFAWADSYYNQISFNASMQQALMNLLVNSGSVPYNPTGYAAIEATLADPINSALNFGTIRPNTTLSGSQISAINSATGVNAAPVVASRGWYLRVADPGAVVRAARGTPACTLYYADGGSIQHIDMASILVQ